MAAEAVGEDFVGAGLDAVEGLRGEIGGVGHGASTPAVMSVPM